MAHEHILRHWNNTTTRQSIIQFVSRATDETSADFVPLDERFTTFDNDGTLWTEQPMPIQLFFFMDFLANQAKADPALAQQQPWKAAAEQDFDWFGDAVIKHYGGDDSDAKVLAGAINTAYEGMPVETLRDSVAEFFRTGIHPVLNRPYTQCQFVPMVELLQYLEANGFTNYICSGGGRDFMRVITASMYGVPPERVIGSSYAVKYVENDDNANVVYTSVLDVFDDGPVKAEQIWIRLGRRPIVAGGNSNGDIPMLRYSDSEDRSSLQLLVIHDDAEREVDSQSGAEEAIARADEKDWIQISIRNDWSQVFPD